MYNYNWSKEKLWKLRNEITLNSLYTDDYDNTFGVPVDECYAFSTVMG